MNDDLISRDAVLDACSQSINILDAMSRIEDLPSVKPKPCEDAISRQTAHEAVYSASGLAGAMKNIDSLPPVTPKQRTGYWIKNTNDYHASCYVCSECGRWHPTHNHSLGFDYCNGCGAKMEEQA